MYYQNDSSDSESINEPPKKIIIHATIEHIPSVTERVIASISKPPKKLLTTPIQKSISHLSRDSRDEANWTSPSYDSFISGTKLASSLIEEKHALSQNVLGPICAETIEEVKDDERNKLKLIEDTPIKRKSKAVEIVVKETKKVKKVKKIVRKDVIKKGKKVYGTQLLDLIKKINHPDFRAKMKQKYIEEQELKQLEKMILNCEKLASFVKKMIQKCNTTNE